MVILKKSFIGECMSNKEDKWDKQFIKYCNLSLYHKNIRIRKKNSNRVSKLLKLPTPFGVLNLEKSIF